jgi:hypothetical protein
MTSKKICFFMKRVNHKVNKINLKLKKSNPFAVCFSGLYCTRALYFFVISSVFLLSHGRVYPAVTCAACIFSDFVLLCVNLFPKIAPFAFV